MVDTLSKEERSKNMSLIKGKDTKPELVVRSYLHKQGLRYSLHRKDLPGKPDIVLNKYRAVVFVNGCYWHRHEGCKYSYSPKSNRRFWADKFAQNVKRDQRNHVKLKKLGWRVFVIWECEVHISENLSCLYSLIVDLNSHNQSRSC